MNPNTEIVNCCSCGVMLSYNKAIQDCGYFYCASCYEKAWDDDGQDEEDDDDES